MNILCSCVTMSYLSGSPLYFYETALELNRLGHNVTIISNWEGESTGRIGNNGSVLRNNLISAGVACIPFGTILKDEYNLIFASQEISQQVIDQLPNTPVINIVHSEYECETPLPNREQIIAYVCVRNVIYYHITLHHNIPYQKCCVIRNGVDRERFKPKEKTPRDYYKIVVPCTLDILREKFLNNIIDSSNKDRRVFLYGIDCGANLHKSDYVTISQDKFDIESEIADTDEVAGILLGRVNIEAWSCGVSSSIYHPETLDYQVFPPPADFDENYNIKNVVKKLLGLFESLDDLTIVIPHYDQRDKLNLVLNDLRKMRNVSIVKQGSFSEGCNAGFRTVKTPYVCFLNDDIRIENVNLLRNMLRCCKTNADIVGCLTNSGCTGLNFEDGIIKIVSDNKLPVTFPSGCCLIMKSEKYKKLNGFDEHYINGAEDIDLFLRAKEQNMKIEITSDIIIHNEGSSTGRFGHHDHNVKLFNSKWKNKGFSF